MSVTLRATSVFGVILILFLMGIPLIAANAQPEDKPDLVPTALAAPASAATEQQIEVSWTVNNQGTGEAQPSWGDNLYLSTDDAWNAWDTSLTSAWRSTALAAGSSYTVTKIFTVPNVPAGDYYLLLVTDYSYNIYESNEDNNIWLIPVSIMTPDLVPTVLVTPASAATQQQIEVSWTVQNLGTGEVQPSWGDSLYLSTDDAWNAWDTSLTSAWRSTALASGSSYTVTKTLTMPNVPAGNYYLLLVTDYSYNVYESNENNNIWLTPVSVTTPDLTPTALAAPASAAIEQQIEVSWTVYNQGDRGGTGRLE